MKLSLVKGGRNSRKNLRFKVIFIVWRLCETGPRFIVSCEKQFTLTVVLITGGNIAYKGQGSCFASRSTARVILGHILSIVPCERQTLCVSL